MSETRRTCSSCGSVVYDNDNACCPFCGDFILDGFSPEEDRYDDFDRENDQEPPDR